MNATNNLFKKNSIIYDLLFKEFNNIYTPNLINLIT